MSPNRSQYFCEIRNLARSNQIFVFVEHLLRRLVLFFAVRRAGNPVGIKMQPMRRLGPLRLRLFRVFRFGPVLRG